mgnify:CR=1 FL=1
MREPGASTERRTQREGGGAGRGAASNGHLAQARLRRSSGRCSGGGRKAMRPSCATVGVGTLELKLARRLAARGVALVERVLHAARGRAGVHWLHTYPHVWWTGSDGLKSGAR